MIRSQLHDDRGLQSHTLFLIVYFTVQLPVLLLLSPRSRYSLHVSPLHKNQSTHVISTAYTYSHLHLQSNYFIYQRFGSAQKTHHHLFSGLEKQVWHRTIIIFSHWNNVAATAMLMFLKHWNILIPFKSYLCYLSVKRTERSIKARDRLWLFGSLSAFKQAKINYKQLRLEELNRSKGKHKLIESPCVLLECRPGVLFIFLVPNPCEWHKKTDQRPAEAASASAEQLFWMFWLIIATS